MPKTKSLEWLRRATQAQRSEMLERLNLASSLSPIAGSSARLKLAIDWFCDDESFDEQLSAIESTADNPFQMPSGAKQRR
jgi:hypothetical protein